MLGASVEEPYNIQRSAERRRGGVTPSASTGAFNKSKSSKRLGKKGVRNVNPDSGSDSQALGVNYFKRNYN